MSDDVNLSYSFETTPPTAATPAEGPLVAFTDCELVGINDAMMLAIRRGNGRQALVAPQVVEALKTCSTFEPLEAHAQRLAATRPELKGNVDMPRQALRYLNDNGLLLHADEVCARLNQSAARTQAPTRVFIITCDRPAAVERLLQSMLPIETLTRHQAMFLIDDSRDPRNRAANAEIVAQFNTTSARDVTYFGADAQQRLLEGLIAAEPGYEAAIRFLIDPAQWLGRATYGRARTLALLLSVGYRAIVMDDDILCRSVRSPIEEPGIGIGSGMNRQAAFIQDEETLQSAAAPADTDPLSGHARALGLSLQGAIAELNGAPIAPEQLRGVNAALANILAPDSPVLVTQCGSWGDPGTGSAHWVLLLDDDSVDRLAGAPQGITRAVEQRINWLGSTRPNIFKMGFMSQMTGLDNSALLPPYFPAFRGEDLLFGATVEALHPRGCVLEYPWSVPHLPVPPRPERRLRDPIPSRGGMELFARALTDSIDYRSPGSPEARLSGLVLQIRALLSRSDRDLTVDFRRQLAQVHAEQLYRVSQQKLRSRDLASSTWQAYLDRALSELQQSLAKEHGPGLLGADDDSAALVEFRALASAWASALEVWPALRQASVPLARAA